jgi:hypothetical protein
VRVTFSATLFQGLTNYFSTYFLLFSIKLTVIHIIFHCISIRMLYNVTCTCAYFDWNFTKFYKQIFVFDSAVAKISFSAFQRWIIYFSSCLFQTWKDHSRKVAFHTPRARLFVDLVACWCISRLSLNLSLNIVKRHSLPASHASVGGWLTNPGIPGEAEWKSTRTHSKPRWMLYT